MRKDMKWQQNMKLWDWKRKDEEVRPEIRKKWDQKDKLWQNEQRQEWKTLEKHEGEKIRDEKRQLNSGE